MSRHTQKRLSAAADAIQAQPFAVDNAYAVFIETGDLPTDLRLARTVVDRALTARRRVPSRVDGDGSGDKLGSVVATLEAKARRTSSSNTPPGNYITGPARRRVFLEAVQPFDLARDTARYVIKDLVRRGGDPTDAEFIPSDTDLPDFGTAALHLVGWPDGWVRPAYEHQMARVMHQHAALRAGTERDEAWYRAASSALGAFLSKGELPQDDVLLLFALTVGEMFALNMDYFGRDTAELLTAFNAIATGSDAERTDALQRVGTLQVQATHRWEGARA